MVKIGKIFFGILLIIILLNSGCSREITKYRLRQNSVYNLKHKYSIDSIDFTFTLINQKKISIGEFNNSKKTPVSESLKIEILQINFELEKYIGNTNFDVDLNIEVNYLGSLATNLHLFLLDQNDRYVTNEKIILVSTNSNNEIVGSVVVAWHLFFLVSDYASSIFYDDYLVFSTSRSCHSTSQIYKTKYFIGKDKIIIKRNGKIKRKLTIIKFKSNCNGRLFSF